MTFLLPSPPLISATMQCLNKTHRLPGVLTRRISNTFWGTNSEDSLSKQYETAKSFLRTKKLPPDVNPRAVFANADLDLTDIDVYGFDYDYTLATYSKSVEKYIYEQAKQALVHELKYPTSVLDMQYDPQNSIRGLHYDIEKGLLLKIDSFHQIHLGSVYRGRQKLTVDEVMKVYKRIRIPQNYVEAHIQRGPQFAKMVQLVDIFAKPVGCLLGDLVQWFMDNNVKYVPESVYMDVTDSINRAHPIFHSHVTREPENFLEKDPLLMPYLLKLKEHNKKIFLITNSPFALVNAGMSFMLGKNWMEMFDAVIVGAQKPAFFTQKVSHFRIYSPEKKTFLWDEVKELRPGKIYVRGNIDELKELTNWEGDRVLYFGDHPYADLADLSLNHGWRTGAIIREVEDEVMIANTNGYKWDVNWSTVLLHLIEENQERIDEHDMQTLTEWEVELEETRRQVKLKYNPYFGSIFRTHTNSTYFSRRLSRFADVYTSRTTNLDAYSLTHSFHPRRGALPHEFRSWFV